MWLAGWMGRLIELLGFPRVYGNRRKEGAHMFAKDLARLFIRTISLARAGRSRLRR